MKNRKYIVFLSLLLSGVLFSQKKIKVLFIGNSYTYVNNLPQLIANIALANGDTLQFDSNCPGGYTFANHFADNTTLAKINAAPWHYVVLQAQSQEPSFSPAQVSAQTLPYAIKLDSVIKTNNACTQTVYYETWGRKFGDASNCAAYPPICTYTGMQNRLKQSYKLFADTCQAILSPAGEAFRNSIAANSSLELYQPDQSHPSLEGSYLTASVFYEVLFHKSVLSNTYNPGVTSANLGFLQQMAHSTVRDSLLVWNLGKHVPWAAFSYSTQNAAAFQFVSQSPGTNSYWYFGDGNTSMLQNPNHVYNASGTYTVSHVAFTNCKRDSASSAISVTFAPNGLNELSSTSGDYLLYPNPCGSEIYLKSKSPVAGEIPEIKVLNSLGQQLNVMIGSGKISTENLASGLYFLELADIKGKKVLRFIKN